MKKDTTPATNPAAEEVNEPDPGNAFPDPKAVPAPVGDTPPSPSSENPVAEAVPATPAAERATIEEEDKPVHVTHKHDNRVHDGSLYLWGKEYPLADVGNIVYWQDGKSQPHCHFKDKSGKLTTKLPITHPTHFAEVADAVVSYLRSEGQIVGE